MSAKIRLFRTQNEHSLFVRFNDADLIKIVKRDFNMTKTEKFVKDGNWSDARTAYADAMEIMVGGDETNVGIDNRDTGHALESIKKKQRDLNDPSYTLAADNK